MGAALALDQEEEEAQHWVPVEALGQARVSQVEALALKPRVAPVAGNRQRND